MEKSGFRISFAFQICFIAVFLVTLTAVFVGYQSYQSIAQQRIDTLSRELLAIVNTAAVQLNAEDQQKIFYAADTGLQGQNAFYRLRDALVAIRDANQLSHGKGSPIYTLRKPADFAIKNELEIVAMSDVGSDGQYYSGARFKALDMHLNNFAGHPAVSGIYHDMEGTWISASAPMFINGEVIGIVHCDRNLAAYFAELAALRNVFLLNTLLCMVTAGFLAWLFSLCIKRLQATQASETVTLSEERADNQAPYKTPDRDHLVHDDFKLEVTQTSVVYDENIVMDAETAVTDVDISGYLSQMQLSAPLVTAPPNEQLTAAHKHGLQMKECAKTPRTCKRLLLAEDDINAQLSATMLLADYGVEFVIVDNGQQVLERLLVDEFDIVLVKIDMPVMDGLTATRLIREDKSLTDLPIIAISENSNADDRARYLDAGISDIIDLGPESDQFLDVLDRLLNESFDPVQDILDNTLVAQDIEAARP